MNYQISLFLAFIFFTQADLLALGLTQCLNNGNYTSNSTYSANLNTALSSLYKNVDSNGFYNVTVGQGIDRANAMVLCRGDVQLSACRKCAQKGAAELLNSCPNQKQAIFVDGLCTLRYSNNTMYQVPATSPRWYLWILENATSPELFMEDLRMLLDDLRKQAASGGSLRKVAAGNITGPDFQTIFALVQCTPDLSRADCTGCLISAMSDIPTCCNKRNGGRVLMPSCNLRFEIRPFFNETRLQELDPAPTPVPVIEPPLQSSRGKDDGNTNRTIITIVVPIVVCLILAVAAIILVTKSKKQKPIENPEKAVDEISTVDSLQYGFSTIKAATNDFSDYNKLDQGGFGTVYKGKLPNGQEIAVKRLSWDSGLGDLEFKNEVLLLAKLRHRNLIRLLGFAMEGMEKLLIYEFLQNASLDNFMFDPINRSYLDWDRCYKIIVGIARGILYLHEESQLRINLKTSNILVDREKNPKIADFGMARLFGHNETPGSTRGVVTTDGYMSSVVHEQFSYKSSDVFSFGVLVLEIISGRKVSSLQNGESLENLLSFVWKNWRDGTTANVVDPFLRSGSGSINDMVRCIHIGLLCVQENAAERPTMAYVVLMLSSSFAKPLAVPSEPAFYFPSRIGSDVSRLHKYKSRNPEYNISSRQDDHSYQNDAAIIELYPR